MCKDCTEDVQRFLNFKSTIIHTENHIRSLATAMGTTAIDLREIYVNENKDTSDQDICRFCEQCVNMSQYTSLSKFKEEMVLTGVMFKKYFPEINLSFTDSTVACSACVKTIGDYIKFLTNCWDIENKINEYCRIEGTDDKGHAELRNVLQFAFKNIIKYDGEDNGVDIIKMKEEPLENEDNKEVHIKYADIVKLEEELDIKDENAEEEIETNSIRPSREMPTHKNPSGDAISRNEVYPCHIKPKSSSKMDNLTRKDLLDVDVYNCEMCPYRGKSKNILKAHTLIHKDPSEIKMYKCEVCPYQGKFKTKLKIHSLTHKDPSEITMYKCEICPYRGKLKQHLKSHMLTHKSSVVKNHMISSEVTYNCETCAYQANSKRDLIIHTVVCKSPSGTTVYKCAVCQYQAKSKSKLRSHIQRIHMDPSERTVYKCEVCPYQTVSKCGLKRHTLLNHKDPSEMTMHKCELCPYQAKLKYYLKDHMLTHRDSSEITMYKCEICPYRGKTRKLLKYHMLVHEDPLEMTVTNANSVQIVEGRKKN